MLQPPTVGLDLEKVLRFLSRNVLLVPFAGRGSSGAMVGGQNAELAPG